MQQGSLVWNSEWKKREKSQREKERKRTALLTRTIETSQGGQSGSLEGPRSQRPRDGVLSRMKVVVQTGGEANVRVHDQGQGNGGIQNATCPMLDGTSSKERNKSN